MPSDELTNFVSLSNIHQLTTEDVLRRLQLKVANVNLTRKNDFES